MTNGIYFAINPISILHRLVLVTVMSVIHKMSSDIHIYNIFTNAKQIEFALQIKCHDGLNICWNQWRSFQFVCFIEPQLFQILWVFDHNSIEFVCCRVSNCLMWKFAAEYHRWSEVSFIVNRNSNKSISMVVNKCSIDNTLRNENFIEKMESGETLCSSFIPVQRNRSTWTDHIAKSIWSSVIGLLY